MRLRQMRRVTQVLFILVLLFMPVFDILRYDAAEKVLYIFGSAWELGLGEEFYSNPGAFGPGYVAMRVFLKAMIPWLIALSIFPLLGTLLGRAFCGWACPEGTLFEFADIITLKVLGRRSIYGRKPSEPPARPEHRGLYIVFALIYLFTIPPFFGMMLSGYFIAPERIWREVTAMELSFGLKAGIIGVSLYMFITFIFVRHAICKYLCAAGLMQMLFGWASPISLAVRFDTEDSSRCTDCRGCEEVCFMDVKPRAPRKNINCVNCGECITACREELGEDRGLFAYGKNRK